MWSWWCNLLVDTIFFSAGKGPSNIPIWRPLAIGSGWWTLVMAHSCGWNYLLAILPLKHLWCLGQVSGGTELEWVYIYIYITHIQMHGIYTHCGHMCFNAEVQVECPHGTAPNVQQDLEDCENLRVCRWRISLITKTLIMYHFTVE